MIAEVKYLSYEFGLQLKQCQIVSLLTPPGTLQHNGVSARCNRTLLDTVRSMMSLTNLPLSFWGYALETATFTLNRAPTKSVETTPYELRFGFQLIRLKPFDLSIASPKFKKRQLRFVSKPKFIRCRLNGL